MPLFEYKAITAEGKKTKGVIDADSLPFAKEKLQREALTLLHLRARGEKAEALHLPEALLLSFTRELYQLLQAGLPLYESLVTIEEKYRKNKAHPFFLDACDSLRGGQSLSTILRRYPKTFDGIYLSMVEAAEHTGALAPVFGQLADLLTKQQKLKKRLIAALTYPAFLGSFCLFLVLGLLLFVIPSLQELFEGRRLHPLTEAVLFASRITRVYGLVFLVTLLLGGGALFALSRKKGSPLSLARLKIPLIHTLRLQAAVVRFTRASSLLMQGGVPLLHTLALAKAVVKWQPLEELIEEAKNRVAEGEPLSAQLSKAPWMPPLVPRMLAIAEETGSQGEMLLSISTIYEDELDKSLSQITALLQPALLLVLGFVVGVVLLSILLPLTDVSSFLAN